MEGVLYCLTMLGRGVGAGLVRCLGASCLLCTLGGGVAASRGCGVVLVRARAVVGEGVVFCVFLVVGAVRAA